MAGQTTAEAAEQATTLLRLSTLEDTVKQGLASMRADLKEHAASDAENMAKIRECTEEIRVTLATQRAGMSTIEKVIGAIGMIVLSALSTLILWKLGLK